MAEAPERTTVTKEVEKTKDKEGKLMETMSSPEMAPLKPEEATNKSLLKHISEEMNELSIKVTTRMLPGELHSLMEKLIKEQTRLVDFQQEMATSVYQRTAVSQLDHYSSRPLPELDVLLSKIHLVSLKLNLHSIKSVDEAQMKTDTKLSEKQDHYKLKAAHSNLESTLNGLGLELLAYSNTSSQFRSYKNSKLKDTKQCMIEGVYYCQQMLVDDFQELVPQTLLVKEPAYQEQYMKNLNVLINTQQQLVQNLTDLQNQKDDLPAGEVGKRQNELELMITEQTGLMKESSKQDDLPAGEIGKQQNELELITEQTDLMKNCFCWVRFLGGEHVSHILMLLYSVYTVNCMHGRMSLGTGFSFMQLALDCVREMYGEFEESDYIGKEIRYSQQLFLDKVWTKRQTLKKWQEDRTEHMRRISKGIDELSYSVKTEQPGQLDSLMEKLIKEQKQLVNFQQEMASSVEQRVIDSQLDQQISRDMSELFVLLSKIHLVSLKLNLYMMKSVDEAQMKTNTKVSEKQHHDKLEEAHFTLQKTLNNLGLELRRSYGNKSSSVQKYDTKWHMTESVYYCQQMLVEDFQELVPQTLLVKKPAFQEQYMKNLNICKCRQK
ncbi:uncharacterized protein LOC117301753 [Asterias rubens]|uniref:uncharacterized protein LOC117301753 n=1 Tax=Asterias rubens TaxID=7604 RepID=UPI0014558D5C|nr:uncharacterized protein LOC117301753 [Asterias rubens]